MIAIPGLSFSGEPKRGPFWWQIITQQKIHTAREPRKRPLKEGDHLFMYWKMRIPADQKAIHKIGEATIGKIQNVSYDTFARNSTFARNDGFIDVEEMQEWFGDPNSIWYRIVQYRIIHWKDLKLSEEAQEILDKCKNHPAFPEYKAYQDVYGVIAEC